jgi:hypothetical protein
MSWGRREPRPFGWYLARTMIPRTVVFAALAAAMLVGEALASDPLAVRVADEPAPVPSWTAADATANPSCVPSAAWQPGVPAAALVVYRVGDSRGVRMPFDTVWARNHDATAVNDVWVVGVCP